MERKSLKVEKISLAQQGDDYVKDTKANRFAMVWQITNDLYSFLGTADVEQRLQRHIGKLIKGQR